jgi:pimeloyl-ACP methyl ester carboxylesterase
MEGALRTSRIIASTYLMVLLTVFLASCASDQEKTKEEYREYGVYRSKIGYDIMMRFYQEALSKWGIPYREIDVDTSYGKTHVVIGGLSNTKPLVLIHGMSSNSSWTWMYNIKDLSRDHRVFAVDVIGDGGKSKPVRLPKNHKDYADWLNEVFSALGIDRALIVGNSGGGFISHWFLYYYPQKVKKMVLLSYSYLDQNADLTVFAQLFLFNFRATREDARKQLEWLNGGPLQDEQNKEWLVEFMYSINKYTKTDYIISPYKSVPESAVKQITTPVLIIMGEKDVIFNVKKAYNYYTKIGNPAIRFEIIPEQGHLLITRHDLICKLILDFFR